MVKLNVGDFVWHGYYAAMGKVDCLVRDKVEVYFYNNDSGKWDHYLTSCKWTDLKYDRLGNLLYG